MPNKTPTNFFAQLLLVAVLFVSLPAQAQPASQCVDQTLAVQVLGSGGPFGAGRASAGYLLWIDGASRLMVDAGGGTFANFGKAGAAINDLSALAISHFHPDHSAELPALLWPQTGSLQIAGPTGSAEFPSVQEYLDGLFGDAGVFRTVNRRFEVEPIGVDVNGPGGEILRTDNFTLLALGVPHGEVPTLAYRVNVGEVSIAFSSDQNGSDPRFVEFVRGVDLLIVHFAGNEDGSGRGDLHAKPSVWAQIAVDAEVEQLMLSHLSMNQNFEANLAALQAIYTGRLSIAEDLMCVALN